MRIYLASAYSNLWQGASASPHQQVTSRVKYPWYQDSFHYMKPSIVENIRLHRNTIFLDSGAFSAYTTGVKIDLEHYAAFLRANADVVHVAANLDDITGALAMKPGSKIRLGGDITYRNQKWLEDHGCKVAPVFHIKEPLKAEDGVNWLKRYLDEGYDYILLGGLVPETTKSIRQWADVVFKHYLTNSDGTPRVKVHGLGLTSMPLMMRYPWYSVDSSSWVMTANMGAVFMDMRQLDGTLRDIKVDFSSNSGKLRDIDSWHYNSLAKPDKMAVLARLEELEADRPKDHEFEGRLQDAMGIKQGFTPECLAASYGWRRLVNIGYFERVMARANNRYTQEQNTLGMEV